MSHYWWHRDFSAKMKSHIQAKREDLTADLIAYGEEAAAALIPSLSDEDYMRIQVRAFEYACTPTRPGGPGMMIAKALCKAVIEILEGAPRELKRKNRKHS